jgi:hypothetical protein
MNYLISKFNGSYVADSSNSVNEVLGLFYTNVDTYLLNKFNSLLSLLGASNTNHNVIYI